MKKLSLLITVTTLSLLCQAQTPYYAYNHEREKVYFSLNTEYAFLSVREPKLPDAFAQRNIKAFGFQSDQSDQKQFQSKKRDKPRYYTRLKIEEKLTDEQYLQLLSDLKRQNKEMIISPYFSLKDNDIIGLSNYFYVKLKS